MTVLILGLLTGIVVDIGNRMQVVPIAEGFTLDSAKYQMTGSISDLTGGLAQLMTERGYYYRTSSELEEVRKMKEKLCYVAQDFDLEMQRPSMAIEAPYTVNGKTITLGSERFRCPEALFNPSLVGKDIPTIQEIVTKSIMKCPVDHRKEIYGNIVLAGGSTCFPGMHKFLKILTK